MIDWIISALATGIAILALLLNLYWRVRNIQQNEIKHLHERIDVVEVDITEIKERLAGLERDVAWLREKYVKNKNKN
mgnify:CR=1 FL=1